MTGAHRLERPFQELFQMRHKRFVITLEDVTALDHSADEVDRLFPSRPVVFRFLTLNEYFSGCLAQEYRRYLERFLHFGKLVFKIATRSDLPKKRKNMRYRANKGGRHAPTYTLRISARLVPPVVALAPAPPEPSVGVGEATPARLGGLDRTLGPVFPRLVV